MSYSPTISQGRIWRYIKISFTSASGLTALPPPNVFICTATGVTATGQSQFTAKLPACYSEATATGFDVIVPSLVAEEPTY
jgi:hypothetical protein